jgi:hypothetical protein
MNWNEFICKYFKHDYHKYSNIKVDTKTMMYVIEHSKYCDRCGHREETLEFTNEKYDVAEGRISWGSGGPCYGCSKCNDCRMYNISSQIGVWAMCPIHEFEPSESIKEEFKTSKPRQVDGRI